MTFRRRRSGVGRAQDDPLHVEAFGSLAEARIVVKAWRIEYNTYRPHSSLGDAPD